MNGYSSYSPGNDHPSIANSNHYAAAQNSYPQPRAFNEHGGGENDPRFNPVCAAQSLATEISAAS